jgi:hypothetical protein
MLAPMSGMSTGGIEHVLSSSLYCKNLAFLDSRVLRPMLSANKTSRKTKRSVCFVEKACLQSQKVLTKGPLCFVNPGAFFAIHKTIASFCELPGFLQKVHWSTRTSGLQMRFEVIGMLLFFRFKFRSPPNDNSIGSDCTPSSPQTADNPHMTMTSNDVLNAFFQGFLDEDGCMIGEEDDCIDDDGAVDDDKLEELMDRQEAENERKRNLLVSLMNIVELEDQEQREADAVDLRRHREQFRGLAVESARLFQLQGNGHSELLMPDSMPVVTPDKLEVNSVHSRSPLTSSGLGEVTVDKTERAFKLIHDTVAALKDSGNAALQAGLVNLAARRYDQAIRYCAVAYMKFPGGNLGLLVARWDTDPRLKWAPLLKLLVTTRLNLSMVLLKLPEPEPRKAIQIAKNAVLEL